MNKRVLYIFSVISVIGLLSCNQIAQREYQIEIKKHQADLNAQYANPEESPLTEEDRAIFEKLDFFPIEEAFCVEAEFKRTPNESTFGMKTSTDRLPQYVKFGVARFTLGDKVHELSIYQNIELVKREGYEDYLFLPFTDVTNGVESYGGGRYLDLRAPSSDKIIIDFNKAYNPYCAYNHKYSCPVPPVENDLDIEIKAGVKAHESH